MRAQGTLSVNIANGASLSDGVFLGNARLIALDLPTLTSATLSFQGSVDGLTWRDVYNNDGTTETSTGASTGARIIAVPAAAQTLPWVKVRSGLTGGATNQGAARVIKLITETQS